jgi:hypothetical protein
MSGSTEVVVIGGGYAAGRSYLLGATRPRHRSGDRDLRRPPQPALHRRLRDARLGGRRRGRPPGDLAAVGRGRPGAGARPARLPGPDHDPAGAQPAAHDEAPQGGLRRPLAARAAAHRAGRGRGRRARRECVDGAHARPRDAVADRARRLRAARGLRRRLRRDRGRRRQEPRGRPPDRPPRPPARRRPPPPPGLPRARPGRPGVVPARARNRGPAGPARRARPGRRPGQRRRRRQAGRAAADHRRRQGGPLHRRRSRQDRHAHRRTHRGQRQPRHSSYAWTARSTASWRSGSRTPASPASTTSATRRS